MEGPAAHRRLAKKVIGLWHKRAISCNDCTGTSTDEERTAARGMKGAEDACHAMSARKPSPFAPDAPPIAPGGSRAEPGKVSKLRKPWRLDDFAPFVLVAILAVVLLWLWLRQA